MKLCSASTWWRRHPDRWAMIGMAAVALALMSPYMCRSDVIPWPRSGLGTDLLNYRWAHVYHLRQSLRRDGEVPLWRGTTMGGEPMIGNPAVMLFYPPQLVMALLPVPILPGLAFLTAAHLWIAGAGAYVLARAVVGVRRLPALVSALAMMLTPRLSSNAVGDVGLTYAMCWVPFCLAWARLALERRRISWAILGAVGLAFQYLLHVHIFFLTAWTIGLFLLYQVVVTVLSLLRRRPTSKVLRRCLEQTWMVGLVALVCAGLVAFALLPFVTYLPYLSRESMTLAEANTYALPPSMLVSALMPSPLKFPEWELYVGLLPLSLIPYAARHPRRNEVGLWVGLAGFAVLFSLGSATPVFTLLFRYVPGFRWLRVPARMWFMVVVAAAMLAALGVDVLMQGLVRPERGQRWRTWLVLDGWTLALATVVGRWVTRQPDQPDWLLGLAGAAALVIGLAGVWLWIERRIQLETAGALLIVALLLDLLPVDAAYMTPVPVDRVFEMPEIGRTLLDPGTRALVPFRVYSARGEIPSHVAVGERLELADGVNSFQFARYVAFIKRASGCELPGFAASVPPCTTNEVSSTAYRDAIADPALLGLFNIRYVITPVRLDHADWVLRDVAADEYLYENLRLQPRAFGVGHVESVHDEGALWRRLAEIDTGAAALIEAPVSWPLPQAAFHVPARLVTYQPNRIDVEIDMPGDGLLVLGEVWVPGWRATDNGVPAQVLRVDGALRGVYLDAGSHQVRLRFLPKALVCGLSLTAFTIVACALALFWERARHEHSDLGNLRP